MRRFKKGPVIGMSAFNKNNISIEKDPEPTVVEKRDNIKTEMKNMEINNKRELEHNVVIEEKPKQTKVLSVLKKLKKDFDNSPDPLDFIKINKDLIKGLKKKEQRDFIDHAKKRYF